MAPSLLTSLGERRARLGWSQTETAERIGISRQAYAAIEHGQSVPSTEIALRLAREMGVSVETLFRLSGEPGTIRELPDALPHHAPGAARVRLAGVGGLERGYRVGPRSTHVDTHADGVLVHHDGARLAVDLFPDRPPEPELVVMGCDPSFGIVAEQLRRDRGIETLWLQGGSREALDALARGVVHVAGIHLRDEPTGAFNAPWIRRLVPFPVHRVHYAEWEQVLVLERGNPHGIRRIDELVRPGIRFLNRARGTGTRALIEAELARVGVPGSAIPGYEDTAAEGHEAVGAAVAAGVAQAGVAIRAVAEARGLALLPLGREPYELVIPRHFLELEAVGALLAVLGSRSVRAQIEAMGGYDTAQMGRPA